MKVHCGNGNLEHLSMRSCYGMRRLYKDIQVEVTVETKI